jgi:hypothetical protein
MTESGLHVRIPFKMVEDIVDVDEMYNSIKTKKSLDNRKFILPELTPGRQSKSVTPRLRQFA